MLENIGYKLKNIVTYCRKLGSSILLLAYTFMLFNNIIFIHSHWSDEHLVAVHAHPYNLDLDDKERKNKEQHSNDEYELYELIFNTPVTEISFFSFVIQSIEHVNISIACPDSLPLYDNFLRDNGVRGPPYFS
ncbi:hypothetical protein [Shivajiella indica]|uniref:Uncharacterized protein n=1 Tax=Shivajiella indica TaxID=872115 RepID=A0ABW5B6W7_9BACT